MREQKEIEVETAAGMARVNLVQIPGMQAGKLLVRLTGIIGPGISGLAVALKGKDSGSASKAAAVLAERLTDAEFESITLQLLRGSRAAVGGEFVDLDKAGIDQLFAGNVEGLLKLVIAALRENYSNFFGVIESQIRAALKEMKAEKVTEKPKPEAVFSGPVSG